VQLPALFLSVDVPDVVNPSSGILEDIRAAVAGGATAVVLCPGGDAGAGGSGELYQAAVRLKELLRGRAALLIADRTDIVDAAGADGAVLTEGGLPTVVAKRMLQDGLALVGRSVCSAAAAAEAAADGANFIILEGSAGEGAAPTAEEAAEARQQQRSSASIPVVAATAGAQGKQLEQLLAAEVDGLLVQVSQLSSLAAAMSPQQAVGGPAEAAAAILRQLGGGPPEPAAPAAAAAAATASDSGTSSSDSAAATAAPTAAPDKRAAVQLSQLLSSSREELVDAERALFTEASSPPPL
jgi:thiamine monophosphate synthase